MRYFIGHMEYDLTDAGMGIHYGTKLRKEGEALDSGYEWDMEGIDLYPEDVDEWIDAQYERDRIYYDHVPWGDYSDTEKEMMDKSLEKCRRLEYKFYLKEQYKVDYRTLGEQLGQIWLMGRIDANREETLNEGYDFIARLQITDKEAQNNFIQGWTSWFPAIIWTKK